MSDQSKDWRVENHTFVGHVLVDLPAETNAMGMKQKPQVGWLPFAHDLRQITCIRQRDTKHPEQTSFEHNGAFVGNVNAAFGDLLPEWLKARSTFDEPGHDRVSIAPMPPLCIYVQACPSCKNGIDHGLPCCECDGKGYV